MSPRRAGLSSVVVIGCFVFASCAMMRPHAIQVQQDGSYRVACDTTLSSCLAPFDKCNDGFDVVRATEARQRMGPLPSAETVNSEAILRCRRRTPMFGTGPQPPAPAAPSTDKAAAPAPACFPGATHACLGPGACQGAQVCLANGTAFGPCDCGTAPAAAPSTPEVTPSAPPAAAPAPPATPAGSPPR